MVEQVKETEDEIKQLSAELINGQEQLKQRNISDAEVERIKKEVSSKVTQYKLLLNDKSALFEEMYSNALMLINRDK